MSTRDQILTLLEENSSEGLTAREISVRMNIPVAECERKLDKMSWKDYVHAEFKEGKKFWFLKGK